MIFCTAELRLKFRGYRLEFVFCENPGTQKRSACSANSQRFVGILGQGSADFCSGDIHQFRLSLARRP
jgi:hypothetical protein